MGNLALGQARNPAVRPGVATRSNLSSLPGYWELGKEDVRKELELVPEQIEKLKELGKQYMKEMRTAYVGREDWKSLSQEERTAKYKEVYENRRKRTEEIRQEVEKILLPHQLEALRDMSVRRMGPSMLQSPRVAEAVQLTEEQKAKIQQIRQEMLEQYKKLQEESSENILKLLTPEQKEKLKQQIQGRRQY